MNYIHREETVPWLLCQLVLLSDTKHAMTLSLNSLAIMWENTEMNGKQFLKPFCQGSSF